MIAAIAQWTAAWGFLGAICYAGPQFTTCFVAAAGLAWLKCLIQALIALIVGTAASAAFAPLVLGLMKMNGDPALRATAALIGLLANPLAPRLIEALGNRVISIVKGDGK